MRLKHLTQRGGTIEHTGPPLKPGKTAVLQVDEDGFFSCSDELGAALKRILPDVADAPKTKRTKEAES